MPVPAADKIVLKDPKDFKLIGTPAKRLDTPDKVNGKAQFGIDVRLPGMKIAAIAICPVPGGKLKAVDEAKAKAVKGVHQVVRLGDAVAVVADHMGAARKGLAALDIEWDAGPNAKLSTADIVRELDTASQKPGAIARKDGDVEKALGEAAKKIEAVYQVPFLAHATMEPMNCTVHVRPGACEVWVGTQVVARAQAAAAEVTGLPKEMVKVHNHLIGGGFGRRLDIDGVTWAVKVAQQVDGPVKVIWTREEDIQHDLYRPYYYDRLSAGLDATGQAGRLDRPGYRPRRSWRAGPRRSFKNGLDQTPSKARRSRLTIFPTSSSIMSGKNRRASQPHSGAVSVRRTTSSWWRVSSTNWPQPPAKTDSSTAVHCLKNPRARNECSNWPPKRPAGAKAAGGTGPRFVGATCLWHLPLGGRRG